MKTETEEKKLIEKILYNPFNADGFSDDEHRCPKYNYDGYTYVLNQELTRILSKKEQIKKNMDKRLGKIKSVKFGIGGYQDCQLGIHFQLGGDSWGVGDSKSVWDPERIKCSENSQWTEEDRTKQLNDMVRYVSSLLKDAKVENVTDLQDIPIECTFDGMMLKEWRILTEVL